MQSVVCTKPVSGSRRAHKTNTPPSRWPRLKWFIPLRIQNDPQVLDWNIEGSLHGRDCCARPRPNIKKRSIWASWEKREWDTCRLSNGFLSAPTRQNQYGYLFGILYIYHMSAPSKYDRSIKQDHNGNVWLTEIIMMPFKLRTIAILTV